MIAEVERYGASLNVDGGSVRIRGVSRLPSPLLEQLKERRDDVLAVLTVPRLPWQLERLVTAATSGALTLTVAGIPDTARYTSAWAATYLVSSQQDEALKRLWEIYKLWQQQTSN